MELNKIVYEDFPTKGIKFLDIFPLIEDDGLLKVSMLTELNKGICILPEARGFLFYGNLGTKLILPLRKKNKLPGVVTEIPFTKEYGTDSFFYQHDALIRLVHSYIKENPNELLICPVTIFDDVLATGGTVEAIYKHFNNYPVIIKDGFVTKCVKLKIVKAQFFVEIDNLKGRTRLEELGLTVESVHHFNGETVK